MADALNQGRAGLAAHALDDGIAFLSVAGAHANLEQLVGLESLVQLAQHAVGEPGAADDNEGLFPVPERAQVTFLFFGELHESPRTYRAER